MYANRLNQGTEVEEEEERTRQKEKDLREKIRDLEMEQGRKRRGQ